MPCRNITQLPKPPKKFRIGRITRRKRRLETKLETEAETVIRIRRLRLTAEASLDRKFAKRCRRLADRLGRCWRLKERCDSAACPSCMRRQRKRIAGWLWKLVAEDELHGPVTATVLPRGMDYGPGGLKRAVAAKLKAALLADLNRCGAKHASGYLFAAIHGEHEPNEDVYRLHWHLLTSGGMTKVVNRLRKRPKYRSRSGDGDVVRQRVRIGRKPLTHLPRPLTYLVQSWWPSRWIGEIGNGEIKRQRKRSRIREPQHSEYLQWLDQQPLEDMILLRKLRATKSGLKVCS